MRAVPRTLALAALAAASVVFVSPGARAQVIETVGQYRGSPQHFAFELKFGPYRPDIDSEFSGSGRTPYQDFFGSGRRLMTTMEFDWEIIRHVGTAALGLGMGYFKETANNPAAANPDPLLRTSDTSSLRLLPFSLSAIYRFDLPYERLRLPLVPYGKLGFDYVYWTVTNGNGEVPSTSGGRGQGGTLGWHATVGLSLVLDIFDQSAANQFDEEMGINHTLLFFEFTHLDASGLGASNRLHVGDTTWNAGIMFEF